MFAIGSMCNPTSLLLRGIRPHPLCSVPAILRGYRLAFHGPAGMATPEPSSGSTHPYSDHFHGVLHLIEGAHLEVLDRIEAGYTRQVVDVELYDGSTQAAWVYRMEGVGGSHGLPT